MIRAIQVSIITILTSFFFFPFFFTILPSVNTKMFLAALGLIAFVIDRSNNHTQFFENKLFWISIGALGVSFCSFLSMTINNTPDNSYLSYIISMWVWLFAAYFCVFLMRQVHGEISLETIGYYLVAVALLQCTLGLLINYFPLINNAVNSVVTGEKYMIGIEGRLHGIGCALDVGGGRLGAILIILAYLILQSIKHQKSWWVFTGLLGAFFYILVIGNMIGRTTTVGAAIAIAYLIFSLCSDRKIEATSIRSFLSIAVLVITIGVIICVGLYNISPEMHKLLRFGFEAFFNYFEYGTFETHSTNMLSEGMIFPDNFKTWIIGDGYMASGSNDPYYIGPADYGFYMNTDAGYSRFIFYFGLIGLSSFILFFIIVCKKCINGLENDQLLFIAILILGLCIWVKVSTDLFLVFAPFLCINLNKESIVNDN
ncbi:hypothetical protein [Phocaeicola plebeius]|uniref:hypothetical protein n=1 Tax=Phocaeicola plebeius TaxID=310297 RepID=UPI0026F18FBB|nr:hypothetical protein [Phocaeicola plebeius]